MLNGVLYAIVAAFVAWEAVAHWAFHNDQRGQTLSHMVAGLERQGGWPVRALVGCAVVALGLHLEGVY